MLDISIIAPIYMETVVENMLSSFDKEMKRGASQTICEQKIQFKICRVLNFK